MVINQWKLEFLEKQKQKNEVLFLKKNENKVDIYLVSFLRNTAYKIILLLFLFIF